MQNPPVFDFISAIHAAQSTALIELILLLVERKVISLPDIVGRLHEAAARASASPAPVDPGLFLSAMAKMLEARSGPSPQ